MLKRLISAAKYYQGLIYLALVSPIYAQDPTIQVDESKIGFKIPTLGDILTFLIIAFFIGRK